MSRIAAIFVTSLLVASGCKMPTNARYIYQDGEYGVIGIPQNSPFGKKNYRKQAEELMAQHFPDGYEIVRAEEVVEGQRVLDKSRKSEFETQPTIDALSQKIALGKIASVTSTQEKDSLPILESRIIYKKRPDGAAPSVSGFASSSKASPELYLDPNEMMRCREKIDLGELKDHKGKGPPAALAAKPADPAPMAARPTDADFKKALLEFLK